MENLINTLSTNNNVYGLQSDLEKLAESFKLLRDTTDQVSAEATSTALYLKDKLNDTTFRFFSVIDSVDDIIVIKDAKGKWKTLNKFTQSLFELNPDQYIGKTDEELAHLYPEHAEGMLYCVETDNKAWSTKKPHRETEKLIVKGRTKYFDIIKTPIFYPTGKPKELIIIGRDITDYVKSQQRNNACILALNSASDNILILNKNREIIFCNDAFLHTFGYNQHSEIEGKSINNIRSSKSTDEYLENMWNTVNNNTPWIDYTITQHTDGSDINCYLSILPVMNGLPEPIHYICIIKPDKIVE